MRQTATLLEIGLGFLGDFIADLELLNYKFCTKINDYFLYKNWLRIKRA